MHIHQSLVDAETGRNIFSKADGSASDLFFSYIAGLEQFAPAATLLFAPHVNSYRRLSRFMSAPTTSTVVLTTKPTTLNMTNAT